MPSQAYQNFKYNLVDVDRLIESHNKLKSGEKGKQELGHITRSGVVMLCASWELYIEELAKESADILSQKLDLPTKLPDHVQKELSNAVKSAKHELRPLYLAGNGWIQVYRDHVICLTTNLNTPKVRQVTELFMKSIGIEDLTKNLSVSERDIDDFVVVRGDIAHRGRHADYIKIGQLDTYKEMIMTATIEIDNLVSDFIRANTDGRKPWNITP